ncbi:sulfotransferase family protein [Thalassovita aquimarina]|uniref:Sulfotransferase n=1 Tax=Thalassovita aquimarina TaxID=2785917 RepID=A0ABS5HNB5_9RHOB|nr:sulfotransferase [Thalassovita aquimarina]MBR9650068.1 sulfotransferase [Thalassovita aquimarina]
MNTIPNAIVIGAGKAGSTSLYNYLDAHPAIFGSRVKELMYFSTKFDQGAEWYLSNFPQQEGVEVYFEATPQYSFRDEFPQVAPRIRDYNPDMSILYIVREPLSRIVSHFNHWARAFPDRFTDIEESLRNPGHRKFFVDRTRYHYQIQAYLDLFPAEKVKVVFLEDLKSDFVPTLNDVYRFLGVEECAETIENRIFNQRKKASDTRVWRLDDISPERRQEIVETLSEDVQQLFSLCGKASDFWGEAYR